jgi:hypothetical protein
MTISRREDEVLDGSSGATRFGRSGEVHSGDRKTFNFGSGEDNQDATGVEVKIEATSGRAKFGEGIEFERMSGRTFFTGAIERMNLAGQSYVGETLRRDDEFTEPIRRMSDAISKYREELRERNRRRRKRYRRNRARKKEAMRTREPNPDEMREQMKRIEEQLAEERRVQEEERRAAEETATTDRHLIEGLVRLVLWKMENGEEADETEPHKRRVEEVRTRVWDRRRGQARSNEARVNRWGRSYKQGVSEEAANRGGSDEADRWSWRCGRKDATTEGPAMRRISLEHIVPSPSYRHQEDHQLGERPQGPGDLRIEGEQHEEETTEFEAPEPGEDDLFPEQLRYELKALRREDPGEVFEGKYPAGTVAKIDELSGRFWYRSEPERADDLYYCAANLEDVQFRRPTEEDTGDFLVKFLKGDAIEYKVLELANGKAYVPRPALQKPKYDRSGLEFEYNFLLEPRPPFRDFALSRVCGIIDYYSRLMEGMQVERRTIRGWQTFRKHLYTVSNLPDRVTDAADPAQVMERWCMNTPPEIRRGATKFVYDPGEYLYATLGEFVFDLCANLVDPGETDPWGLVEDFFEACMWGKEAEVFTMSVGPPEKESLWEERYASIEDLFVRSPRLPELQTNLNGICSRFNEYERRRAEKIAKWMDKSGTVLTKEKEEHMKSKIVERAGPCVRNLTFLLLMVQEVLDLFFEVHTWSEMTVEWITFDMVYPDRFHYFRRYLDDLHFGNSLEWIQGSEIGLTHDEAVYDELRAILTGPHVGVSEKRIELRIDAARIVRSDRPG